MPNKKRKTGQRVHRGQTAYISDNHLPPQNLFAPPRPNNLITVPSGDECNGGSSKDDEYFRLGLFWRENAKGDPARDAIFPTMQRSLRKKAAPGFGKAFWSKLELRERVTRSGIYAGTGFLSVLDGHRIDKIAAHIARGIILP